MKLSQLYQIACDVAALVVLALLQRKREAGREGEELMGNEPNTNAPLLFFGVSEVGRAAQLLDQTASAAAGREAPVYQPTRIEAEAASGRPLACWHIWTFARSGLRRFVYAGSI